MQVFPIVNAAGAGTPTLGAVIKVGSNLQAIAADRASNIWVVGSTFNDTASVTNIHIIKKGSSTASSVTGLTYTLDARTLGGMFH